VSRVLETAVAEEGQIHLRCYESTHELLLEQLSQHKLDMILSDCPVDSSQQAGLFSVKLGECAVGFYCGAPLPDQPFPECLRHRKLLIPGRRSMLGRTLLNWFSSQGIQPEILGEFDDAALMAAFGQHNNAIFVAPALYAAEMQGLMRVHQVGQVDSVKEKYYVIFAERMIQHPAVQRICHTDFSGLFSTQYPQREPTAEGKSQA
jgi:LysR family transcriptional activator of nhaA